MILKNIFQFLEKKKHVVFSPHDDYNKDKIFQNVFY